MSRSRRKTPVQGITTAQSEKSDKRAYNRRFRRATKQAVQHSPSDEVMPILREHSDPWGMSKDGKHWFDPQKYPEAMRK